MIEQCEKCALYNSLGCPYDYEIASKSPDCDEFRPNEENKITDPIKRRLFKLLKDSPSLNVLYEEQWTESVDYLVSHGVTITETAIADGYRKASEVAIEVIEEIERKIADLEYHANTPRKTVRVEELKAQVNWVLHEVVPQTLAELKKKYKEVPK